MKIGILYICTGKYDRFFKDFYESAEKFFLTGSEKTYYVWTDSEDLIFDNKNIVKIHQAKLGWPFDTMMRFKMFDGAKSSLVNEDYIFFFNANMRFLAPVNEEILPVAEDNHLVSVLHATFYNTGIRGTFETRPESNAYIPTNENPNYFQGCLFGGRSAEFLEMNEVCKANVDKDLENNLIAIWHDESHMNKYFSQKPPKKLHPGYAYPEMLNLQYPRFILQLEKMNTGGHKFLRS